MEFSVPSWAKSPLRSRQLFLSSSGHSKIIWCVDEKPCYLIGRSPNCDVTVDNRNASRVHACLCHADGGQLFIMDLGSVHGTFLNGERLEANQRKRISVGSIISVADSKDLLTIESGSGGHEASSPPQNAQQADSQEEYDPFGDIGAEESSPAHHGLPIPPPPKILSGSGSGFSVPPVHASTSEVQTEGTTGDKHQSRDVGERRHRDDRGGSRSKQSDRRADKDKHGDSHRRKRDGDRRERKESRRRDRSPHWRGKEGRRDRRYQEKKRGPAGEEPQDASKKRRKSAFSSIAAPVDASADIVKSMMHAPGQNPAPALGLSLEQKKELLWGKKKAQTHVDTVAPAFGVNRWDTAQFGSTEEQSKFQRLMGVKGNSGPAALVGDEGEGEGERKVLAGEKQEEVLRSVEEHFVAGLRRADGRTVGLGL